MAETYIDPETLWDNLLSGEAEMVKKAFSSLNSSEKLSVLAHLKRMSTEPGWHPSQRTAAQTALGILNESSPID